MEEGGRARVLPLRVKAVSKETPGNKAVNVCDLDQRSAWSTGTTAKEWIILELEESCLLRELRIVNKSVAEWEISLSLAYKDKDTFTRAKTKCDAPRRDATYAFPFPACRFIRIFCFRGNPISIHSVQAVGIPVAGLEPESQPLIEFFTPLVTIPGAHGDAALAVFRDAARLGGAYAALLQAEVHGEGKRTEDTLRYLSQLSTVYSPLLVAVRPTSSTPLDLIAPPTADAPFAVSSNFAAPPRRIKPEGDAPLLSPSALLSLLRLTLSDASFAALARAVASAASHIDANESEDARSRQVEGLLWLLIGGASFPVYTRRLSSLSSLDLTSLLPLFRVLALALRSSRLSSPSPSDSPHELAKSQPLLERFLSLISALLTNATYSALLAALRPALTSGAQAQEQAACLLLDLAAGPLSSLLPQLTSRATSLLDTLIGCTPFLIASPPRPFASAVLLLLQLCATGAFEAELRPLLTDKPSLLFVLSLLQHQLSTVIASPSSSSLSRHLSLFLQRASQHRALLPVLQEQHTSAHITSDAAIALLAPDLAALPALTSTTPKSTDSNAVTVWQCPALAPPEAHLPAPSGASFTASPSSSIPFTIPETDVQRYLQYDSEALRLSALPARRAASAQFEQFAKDAASKGEHGIAVESLLLAAEVLLNPCFLASRNAMPSLLKEVSVNSAERWWSDAEERRDEAVLELLAQAAVSHFTLHHLPLPAHEAPPPNADVITRVRAQYSVLFQFITDELAKPTVVLTEVLLHALLLLLRAAPQPPSPVPLMRALTSSASALHLLLLNASVVPQSISSTDVLRRVWIQVHALFAAASAPEGELLPASEWLSAANTLTSRDAPLLRYFVWLACVRAFRRASLSPMATLEALATLLKDDLVPDTESGSAIERVPSVYGLFPSLHQHFADLARDAQLASEETFASLPSSDVPEALTWLSRIAALPAPPAGPSAHRWSTALPRLLCALLQHHASVLSLHLPRILSLLLSTALNHTLPLDTLSSLLEPLHPLLASTADSASTLIVVDQFASQKLIPALAPTDSAAASSSLPSEALVLLAASVLPRLSAPIGVSIVSALQRTAHPAYWQPPRASTFVAFSRFFTDAALSAAPIIAAAADLAPALAIAAESAVSVCGPEATAMCSAAAKCIIAAQAWQSPLVERLQKSQQEGVAWASIGLLLSALLSQSKPPHPSDLLTSLSSLLRYRALRAPRLSYRLSVLSLASDAWPPSYIDSALCSSLLSHPEPELRTGILSALLRASVPPHTLRPALSSVIWPSLPTLASDALSSVRQPALTLLQRLLPCLSAPPDATAANTLIRLSLSLANSSSHSDRLAVAPLLSSLILSDVSNLQLIAAPLWTFLESLHSSSSSSLLSALLSLRPSSPLTTATSNSPDLSALQAALSSTPSSTLLPIAPTTTASPIPTALADVASRLLLEHRLRQSHTEHLAELSERLAQLEASAQVLQTEGVCVAMPSSEAPLETRIAALEAALESERSARRAEEAKRRRAVELQHAHEREAAWHRAKAEEQRAVLALIAEREANAIKEASRLAALERERERTREARLQAELETERRGQREAERRSSGGTAKHAAPARPSKTSEAEKTVLGDSSSMPEASLSLPVSPRQGVDDAQQTHEERRRGGGNARRGGGRGGGGKADRRTTTGAVAPLPSVAAALPP